MMYLSKSALSLTIGRPLLQTGLAGAFNDDTWQKQVSRLACPVCLAGHGQLKSGGRDLHDLATRQQHVLYSSIRKVTALSVE